MLDRVKPVVIAPEGVTLTANEMAMWREQSPLGVMLFRRNIQTPEQVTGLIADIRAACGWSVSIWIDQEGGRVQRFAPPHWPQYKPAAVFGALYRDDPLRALRLLHTHISLIAADLRALGVDVDCLPLLDLPQVGADNVIGDRAFGDDPATVIACGKAVIDSLTAAGIVPVIKHIPGHGRAMQDSHLALPVVEVSDQQLWDHDMVPFVALKDAPLAMTAHIVYRGWDALPATLSPKVIGLLRERMGYQGLLISDDLDMKALAGYGSLRELCRQSIQAGVNIMLYCPGDFAGNRAVLDATEVMSSATWQQWQVCEAIRQQPVATPDPSLVADYWQWAHADGA